MHTKEDEALITLLSKFPIAVGSSASNYKPHIIARYLLELSQAFNEFYHTSPILQSDEETKKARLMLIIAVKQVLANGLELLGISAPDAM